MTSFQPLDLTSQNELAQIVPAEYKKINGAYLFDKKLIPDLSKVTRLINCLEKLSRTCAFYTRTFINFIENGVI